MKLLCRSKSRELDSKNMAITTCGSLESATMFQVALGAEWWHAQPRVRACLEPRRWWYCVVHHGQAPQKLFLLPDACSETYCSIFQNPHIHLCYFNI